jgi:AAA+ ATPase superfamily predicted ATPase
VPTGFIGREAELGLLSNRLDRVVASGTAIAVAIRGRRQVGKSRLVQEFCDRSGVPYFFYAGTKGESPVGSITSWVTAIRDSGLPLNRDAVPDAGSGSGSWPDAFRILYNAMPEGPSIVVIDEVPWLAEQDEVFDGALQTAWDRLFASKPVLLLLLGSDIHMMERLTAYDRPFFGRADNLVLQPLNPAESGSATGLSGADAIDAYLVSGGLPGILRTWPSGTPALQFMESECAEPAAPFFSVAESALMAEFPMPDHSRRVLEAIGSGDRTFANIAATAGSRQGPLPSGTLSPLLRRLVEEKRVIAIDEPVSTQPGKPALYRVADPSLRFHLAAGRAAQDQARRGRPDAAMKIIRRRWQSWRGRAVEPVVREALLVAAASGGLPWPDVEAVGAWWNRRFDPEVDVVGADRSPGTRQISFVGSIKWLDTPFDGHHLAELKHSAAAVPGYKVDVTGHVVVSASGTAGDLPGIDVVWGPDDVVASWS